MMIFYVVIIWVIWNHNNYYIFMIWDIRHMLHQPTTENSWYYDILVRISLVILDKMTKNLGKFFLSNEEYAIPNNLRDLSQRTHFHNKKIIFHHDDVHRSILTHNWNFVILRYFGKDFFGNFGQNDEKFGQVFSKQWRICYSQ